MLQTAKITPIDDEKDLSDIVASIMLHEDQISEIRASINKMYAHAEVLGAHKAGLKLAIAHSRMTEEKRARIRDGYQCGAQAMGRQNELVF